MIKSQKIFCFDSLSYTLLEHIHQTLYFSIKTGAFSETKSDFIEQTFFLCFDYLRCFPQDEEDIKYNSEETIELFTDIYGGCIRKELKSASARILRLVANNTESGMTLIVHLNLFNLFVNLDLDLDKLRLPYLKKYENLLVKGESQEEVLELISASVLCLVGLLDSPNFGKNYHKLLDILVLSEMKVTSNPVVCSLIITLFRYYAPKTTRNDVLRSILIFIFGVMNDPESPNSVIFLP